MNLTLRYRLFFIIVFSVIFCQIPSPVQLNFIGGFLGKNLNIYLIFFSFLYYAYYRYKNKEEYLTYVKKERYFFIYIIFYISVLMISFFHGLFIYPYYDTILSGPVVNLKGFSTVHDMLQYCGISLSELSLLKLWMIMKPMKRFFIDCFWFFSVPLLIYYWFKDDPCRGLEILRKATICAVVCVSLYGVLDILYLSGSMQAQIILMQTNPVVHSIKDNGSWWPPLLWDNQLRSLFAEPSYFGIYAAFSMPWVWYTLLKCRAWGKKLIFILLLFLFTYELFLTRARTANALFVGEIILLLGIALWKYKNAFRGVIQILFISLFAFLMATYSISYMPGSINRNDLGSMGYNSKGVQSITLYVEDNFTSIASSNHRSNLSRYSILKANVAIGMDYPILGVGKDLRNGYVPDYLPSEAFEGEEIQSWLRAQKEQGILKMEFPQLGEYSTRFAETGALGLMIYLFPAVYLLRSLLKVIASKRTTSLQKEQGIFLFLSMIGIMASGFGDTLYVTSCYWLLIGIGYAFVMSDKVMDV